MNKPFSEACLQNRTPILEVIQPLLKTCQTVLEIGSGTGQHAVYFTEELTHINWQTSDRSEHHQGIKAWLQDANNPKIQAPLALDVLQDDYPQQQFDAIFSANTLHIMSKPAVASFFKVVEACIQPQGVVMVYGPFNYGGQYTSDSNAQFDGWLKSRDENSGIKDFEWINQLATAVGLQLQNDHAMPANNRILQWQKT